MPPSPERGSTVASNDVVKPLVEPLPEMGIIERIIRLPAANEQTPLRVVCLLVLAGVLAATPMPFQVIGIVTLVVLALSFGHLRK
jgi:hypothetical protein